MAQQRQQPLKLQRDMTVKFENTPIEDSNSGAISLAGWLRRREITAENTAVKNQSAQSQSDRQTQRSKITAAWNRAKITTGDIDADPVEVVSSGAYVSADACCADTAAAGKPAVEHKPVLGSDFSDAAIVSVLKTQKGNKKFPQQIDVAHLRAIDAENAAEIAALDTRIQEAKTYAVKMLARKAMSAKEVYLALLQIETPAEIAEQIVDEFCAANYIDETALAESIVAKASGARGRSIQEIRRKLKQRYLPDTVISAVLSELDEAEQQELLVSAAYDRAVKLADLEYEVAKRRLLGYLARRGWSGYEAIQAATAALQQVRADGDSNVRFR